jgi:hypothetical protein
VNAYAAPTSSAAKAGTGKKSFYRSGEPLRHPKATTKVESLATCQSPALSSKFKLISSRAAAV